MSEFNENSNITMVENNGNMENGVTENNVKNDVIENNTTENATENAIEMINTADKEIPLEITVDDGTQRIPIKNKHGDEVGVFFFRPTDIGIIDRYNKMAAKFDEITAPLENVSISPDGTAADDDTASIQALNEAEKRLFDAVDYLFGGNMAEAFFGKMHPFSPVNGSFYCESAIEAVGKYISAQFEQETQKVNRRVDRYTNRYTRRHSK